MSQRNIRYLTLDDLSKAVTISVEEASHLLGISRTAAYEAVKREEISVVQYGKRLLVLAKPLYEILSGLSPQDRA